MCDMDCGDDGGFDAGADLDVSEGMGLEDVSDVDSGSAFEGMNDVIDVESDTEVQDVNIEVDNLDMTVDEYQSLDMFEETEYTDEFSNDEYEEIEGAAFGSIFHDEISEIDTETLEEGEIANEDNIVAELAQLDAVEPEMMDADYLEELLLTNADDPEFVNGINRLIDEGKINVMDSSEVTDDVSEEDVKVLTRDVTEAVLESRDQDTDEVLDNYRENLEARGVAEEQIEAFLEQEREKMDAEYESLDNGRTSSNIYEMPLEWDAVAEELNENVPLEIEDMDSEISRLTEESDELISETDEEEQEMLLEVDSDKGEENSSRFITYYPEEIEEAELASEYSIEMPEMIMDEEIDDEITEEALDEINIGEDEIQEIETELSESEESSMIDEDIESAEEAIDAADEVSEVDINYDEIYEEIEREALEQGYKDVDIEANEEILEHALERFEEDNWNTLEMYEQREAINDLSDYIKDIVGFENLPSIEYYYSSREGEYGGYDPVSNSLRINEGMLHNSEEAADTVAHELWHAHQQECAMNPKSPRDYQYQYNFENYINPEYGYEQYQNQLVEAEARSFASQFKGKLASISGRSR